MAWILNVYKKKLPEYSKNKSHQRAFNEEVSKLEVVKQEKERQIRLAKHSAKLMNENLRDAEKEYHVEQLKIREKYYTIAEKETINLSNYLIQKFKFPSDTLTEAQDFYAFIHLILATFNPSRFYQITNQKGNPIVQSSYMDLLRFLPPDANIFLNPMNEQEIKLSLKEVFAFQFIFKKAELLGTLKECLQPGERIRMTSTNHAAYLTVEENAYTLYDPDDKETATPFRTIDELLEAIDVCFFKNSKIETDIFPISMNFFKKVRAEAKTEQEVDPIIIEQQKEVKINELLQSILDKRPEKDKNINLQAWDGTTALQVLAECGADFALRDSSGESAILSAFQLNRFDMVAFMLMNVCEADALSKNWNNMLSTQNINSLVSESIKIINKMDVSVDEKIRLFEKITNQENALGKILNSFKTSKSAALFPPEQKDSSNYLEKIKAVCDALRLQESSDISNFGNNST